MDKRLATMEAELERYIRRLPTRDRVRRGYYQLDILPEPEWLELEALLERAYDAAGNIDHTRLSPDERRRAAAILNRARNLHRERAGMPPVDLPRGRSG